MTPQLEKTFPQDEYLHTYCSVATYILTLLVDGYKFDEHTWSSIHFTQKVKALWGIRNGQEAVATSLPWPDDIFSSSSPGVP